MKSLSEEMGGTYRREGDYVLPNLVAPDAPVLGIWGQRRRRYLTEHRKPISIGMLLDGTLNDHLTETDRNAEAMFSQFVTQLTMLYEAYSDCNRMDDDQIKADFNELYRLMNGMELRKMGSIIYPVCTLCRDHKKAGFVNGVKIGIRLLHEMNNE